MQLAEKVSFMIFADNFFTSMPLIEKLLAKGICYTGTVRKNRMSKCTLMTDLSKKGRGSYDHRIESNTNTVCLKWQDTKAVTLMSTYAGPEPLGKARRWDKLKKSTSTLISQTSSRSTMLPWEELTCWMHILHAVSFPSGPVAGI